jgi:phosphoserine aminotransferase
VDSAYVHIVSNETIQGIELGDLDVGHKVQVADMTSTLLSRCVRLQSRHMAVSLVTILGIL